MYGTTIDKVLPGKTIEKIYFNKQNLRFDTDLGSFAYVVEGGCCSQSEFWDFYGVKTLIGSRVLSVESVELDPSDGSVRPGGDGYRSVQYYGYKIVCENPEFGEVTAVFSFRNTSNGYYGGSLEDAEGVPERVPEITDNITEATD